VSSSEFVSSNIDGVHNILELIKNFRGEGSKKPVLIHFSTDEVYGDIVEGTHTEADLLKPSNPYSATKAAADMLISAWGRTYNVPYMILRPTNNYGIGQYIEKLIPKSIKYLTLGRRIPLHSGGESCRNWLHANDTAEAVMTLIDKGTIGEIYNIAGGFEQKNIETVTKILNEYNKINASKLSIDQILDLSFSRPGEDVRYALDDEKLRTIGWKPKSKFNEELPDIVQYYYNKFIW
jgi:dTDP-glucose 4,6-dehydratase